MERFVTDTHAHIVTHIFFPHTEARRHGEKTKKTMKYKVGCDA